MKLNGFCTFTSVFGLIGLALVAPAPAFAQAASQPQATASGDQTGEIVVTAQRRSELQRDVPITVTTLSKDTLEQANVNTLSDTAKLTPSLRFDAAGSFVQPTIRGVGTAVSTSGGGPNVGIYVDGFFQSNSETADFQLMNVKSIQVLKGPQGTLFGRNTTGGAIIVTSAEPSTTPGEEVKVSVGSFNAQKYQAYTTFGLTKDVAFDLEAQLSQGDGYFHNIITPGVNEGKYQDWSVRTGLKAQLADNVSLLLRYGHSETDDPINNSTNAYVDTTGATGFFNMISPAGLAYYKTNYGVSNSKGLALVNLNFPASAYATQPGMVATLAPVLFKTISDTFQGTIKADLGFADLTSYTQYRKDRSTNVEDLGVVAAPTFYIYIGVKDKTMSQEFLLNSKPGSRLQWTVGLNYYQNTDDWSNIQANLGGAPAAAPGGLLTLGGVSFGGFGGSSTTATSFAGFADLTYEITPQLFLTAGGRYSYDKVSDAYFKTNQVTPLTGYTAFDGSGDYCGVNVPACPAGTVIPVPQLTDNRFTPRVVLRYKPNEQSSVYASYTKGYKAGILNVGGDSLEPVAPEDINAFEVGYKYETRKFGFDLSSYYYDYKNLQVSSYQNGAAQIRNAASSEIYGIEAQFRYRFDSHLDVNAGGAWTHARYKSFTNAPYYGYCDPTAPAPTPTTSSPLYCAQGAGGLVQSTIDASGYHMQRSPDFTANVAVNYGFDLGGGRTTLSGNLYYTSSFYFDPEQQFKQNGYALLGLRAQWVDPSQHVTLAVYGDNVTDKRYQTQVLFNTVGIGSVWSPPATWGASVGLKF